MISTRLLLSCLPFRFVQRLANRKLSSRRSAISIPRAVWAVIAVSRRIPGASCLTQALALERILAAAGEKSQVHIGVAKDARGFASHAWVEHAGSVILGNDGELDRYSPIIAMQPRNAESHRTAATNRELRTKEG